MNAMDKPPRANEKEKKAQKGFLLIRSCAHSLLHKFFYLTDQQAAYDKMKQAEKKHLADFRIKIETMVNDLIKDDAKQKIVFETMDKVHRAVV